MAASDADADFRPALIVVDFQNDFCPPDGSLAVGGGRDIAPTINSLLDLPFVLKVATKDFHPRDHISFASNHPPPNNKPFETMITIQNPDNPDETETTRLWPDHCVQGTRGSDLVAEMRADRIDHVVEKGQDRRVEMYSAFSTPFKHPPVATSDLAATLEAARVTHVYTAGLAYDYCVKQTAVHAAEQGFVTYVVRDASRPVHPESEAVGATETDLRKAGVHIVQSGSPEVDRVKRL